MGGGSYNYLYSKEPDELLRGGWEDLEHMARRLARLGYAADAAGETEELLLILRQVQVRLEARQRRLADIWRAVEWWDSGDSGEDGVKAALAQYREKGAL